MEWIMNWWWATVIGPIVLAVALIVALTSKQQLSTGEKSKQAAAVDRLYNARSGDSARAEEGKPKRERLGASGNLKVLGVVALVIIAILIIHPLIEQALGT